MKSPINYSSPITKAVLGFQDHIFGHPIARDVFNHLASEMNAISTPQLMVLTGPAGVGKETLVRLSCKRIIEKNAEYLASNVDAVPVISMNAVPPSNSVFSWKDFYIRLLTAQNEPLVDRKLYIPRQMSLVSDNPFEHHRLQQSVGDALRRSVEEHLKNRKVRLLIINKAHHIFLGCSPRKAESLFENLNALAEQTGTTILLVGTYRLLDILGQSGELASQSQIINFRRYDIRIKGDREAFNQILDHLSGYLSEHVPTNLNDCAEFYYQKSGGCVGILKDWLVRCLEYALTENAKQIDASFAERFAPTNKALISILEDACSGENKLNDVDESRVMDLLKHGIEIAATSILPTPKKQKPGKRKPTRDPVGEVFA